MLFVGTILMIGWIVIALLRWIQQLTSFGRMEDAIRRVEKATTDAVELHDGPILLAGRPPRAAPPGWVPIKGRAIGHISNADLSEMREQCERERVKLRVSAAPGTFVDSTTTLAWASGAVSDDCAATIVAGFTVEINRRFNHDPRFGMIVLSEIASRALSPAINDPGSAISVLAAGQRVAHAMIVRSQAVDYADGDTAAIELSLEDMMEDLIYPIARDGAALVEVGIRLQRTLGSLASEASEMRVALQRLAKDALERALATGLAPIDRERIERAHRRAFNDID